MRVHATDVRAAAPVIPAPIRRRRHLRRPARACRDCIGNPQRSRCESGTIVKSPIVGTYYDAPKPGDPPFVKVGDAVEPGQVLCIIESMKLMNEIEAEIAGIVVAKLVENGRPVEYGEALFAIRRVADAICSKKS